ncbi:MAG: glycosyltransferase family 4 protein [Syntrophorhabdaceae bacterium]|nr:glycosyltransferase family 4 protein [Syntrophorhabdaceae bacterium]
MRILLSSYHFFPSVGGTETVAAVLAKGFVRSGHVVKLVTNTPSNQINDTFPYEVIRRPSVFKHLKLTAWADLVFHNHISLRNAWPMLFIHRPWVVTHHQWIAKDRLNGRLKRFVLRWATQISVSSVIAADFQQQSVVINSPYDEDVFRETSGLRREKDLVFLGRFVPEKGLPVLLHALVLLRKDGLQPNLTVVGKGPEEQAWRILTDELGLSAQVKFVGVKMGYELTELLNSHKVLVVPSVWNEPFGVVALEGMACGCIVVGSEGGGLKEAIGPGGLTFPNGDAEALAVCIRKTLFDQQIISRCLLDSKAHFKKYTGKAIANRYLDLFRDVVKTIPREE